MYRNTVDWLIVAVISALVFGLSVRREANAETPQDAVRCDLLVVGGTPCGIACAVRAAREGLSVTLVNHHEHLGGMLSSGLCVWDTQYEGHRAPIYDELRAALMDYYRKSYGDDSQQYRDARPGKSGYTNGRFEPHVAEKLVTQMVAREPKIRVLRSLVPVAVRRDGELLQSVVLESVEGGSGITVTALAFADCTYEGDLLALAGVPYRVGRESRDEYDEPHAGVIFMRPTSIAPNPEAARLAASHDQLNLRKFAGWQVRLPQSTGEADEAVQACNYRTILTTDPDNRVAVPQPENYAPYFLKSLEVFSGVKDVPNNKFSWNRPQIIGLQTEYVEGDWKTRRRVMDAHWEMTLGLLYFLQHDPTVPEPVREGWLKIGLAKDEFPDNRHRPYEMYVRETRRLQGRKIYTQHDAMLAPSLGRAPVHTDSVAVTEWYMDSHSCSLARVPGGMEEGKAMLHYETFPGQIPYRCLLPRGVDNLLVPLCLSATHVAWGTVRLEPVFMQTGESAGLAAALAAKNRTPPARLDPNELVRKLCERRSMVTFFNDCDVAGSEPWIPAVQYFGTRGFFPTYNACPSEPLTRPVAEQWAKMFARLVEGNLDEQAAGEVLHGLSTPTNHTITTSGYCELLQTRLARSTRPRLNVGKVARQLDFKTEDTLTRGNACRWMYQLLANPMESEKQTVGSDQ